MNKTIENNRSILRITGEHNTLMSRAVVVIVMNTDRPSQIECEKSETRKMVVNYMAKHFPKAGYRILPSCVTRQIGTCYPNDGSFSIRLDFELTLMNRLEASRYDYEPGFDAIRIQSNVGTGDYNTFMEAMTAFTERMISQTYPSFIKHMGLIPLSDEEKRAVLEHLADHTGYTPFESQKTDGEIK